MLAVSSPDPKIRGRPAWRDHPLTHVLVVFLLAKLLALSVALVVVPQFDAVTGNLIERDGSNWVKPDVGPCPDPLRCTSNRYFDLYSMWFRWDSMHYVTQVETPLLEPVSTKDRALLGAEPGHRRINDSLSRFAWAPLYMLLGKPLYAVLGSAGWALLIVSNVAFIGALWFAYRLGVLLFENAADGRLTVTMLALLPTAFLMQAVLSEPLFLCLSLATFVFAHEKRWWWAALTALGLGLTRSTGMLIVLPLLLLILQQNGWVPWRWTMIRGGIRALPALLAAPLGWGLFVLWSWGMTGYWDAYSRVQANVWNVTPSSPLRPFREVFGNLTYDGSTMRLVVVLVLIAVLIAGIRFIPVHFVVWGVLLLIAPFAIGGPWANSLLRYVSGVFPLALLAVALLRRWPHIKVGLVACLAAFQAAFFVMWQLYWSRSII